MVMLATDWRRQLECATRDENTRSLQLCLRQLLFQVNINTLVLGSRGRVVQDGMEETAKCIRESC